MADSCYDNQVYFANNVWQAIVLISSNLILILVVIKAFEFKFYTRTFLYVSAFFFSMLYHTCIIKPLNGVSCVLGLCTLKLLDYIFAYGVLFASILLLIPFTPFYVTIPNNNKDMREFKKIRVNFRFIEDWIIYIIIGYNAIILGPVNQVGTLSWYQITIPVSLLVLVLIIAWMHIYFVYKRRPSFDAIDLIVAIVLAIIGVIFFLIEYNLSSDSYWLTHSLWHIFAGLSQLYLLEARNKKTSGFYVLLPKQFIISGDGSKRVPVISAV